MPNLNKADLAHFKQLLDNYDYIAGLCECALDTIEDEDERKICREIWNTANNRCL